MWCNGMRWDEIERDEREEICFGRYVDVTDLIIIDHPDHFVHCKLSSWLRLLRFWSNEPTLEMIIMMITAMMSRSSPGQMRHEPVQGIVWDYLDRYESGLAARLEVSSAPRMLQTRYSFSPLIVIILTIERMLYDHDLIVHIIIRWQHKLKRVANCVNRHLVSSWSIFPYHFTHLHFETSSAQTIV